MISKSRLGLVGSLLVMVASFLGVATAQHEGTKGRTVFRIGTFDRSSAEFSGKAPKQVVKYVVGQSNPARDWYASQPAELSTPGAEPPSKNASSAARTIAFSLEQAPAAAYRLHVSLLIEGASVPTLRIGINGKAGTFYPQPKLDSSMGDMVNSFDAAYSHADVSFDFPGSYLHSGTNTITLQAREEADREVPDAGLTYDAIELDRSGEAFHPGASSAEILPTIFYQQHQGQLDEMVDATVRYGERIKSGSSVDLSVAGKRYHQTLRGGQDFGEEKIEFAVPEFTAPAQARLWWEAGRAEHKEQVIRPGKKWTLFLVPHIHLDIGYSDYQAKVAAIQSRVIDEAMELTAQHPDFRFSMDGAWDLDQFMKTRTPAEQQRAIAAMQKRQLFIPAQYANLLTGFPTAETLIRSLYSSANFSREHGTPFNYANITDVPSYSWSYASILASAGIKYFLSGSDNVRAPVLLQGHLNENSPFWWEGPDGQKVLFWYSRHYEQMQVLFGLPPLVSAGHDTLPLFLQMYDHPGYRANAAIIFGTQVENTDLFPQQAELAQQWNSVYAYPKLQYAGFHEALKEIADQFGNDIPTVSGDGGPYWEDGIASDAFYAAMERQNESRGPSAEKLATLTSLVNPNLAADKKDLDRMWKDMLLMDEHTWDSYNSITDPTSREAVRQLAVKDLYAVKAHALAEFLARNSMATLADSISAGKGSLIVFNTLNWKRSGLVEVDLNRTEEIVDPSTGQAIPVEVLAGGKDFQHVRFVAADVPATGYRVFQLRHADKPVTQAEATRTTTLESRYYRVQLDTASGAVRSIYDKQLRRELVDQGSPYRFGQYLYVTGGDKEPNSLLQYRPVSPKPDLQIHGSRDGKLVSITRTPYGWVARMESTAANTPKVASEIRLFEQEKKIEFVEDVNKNQVDSKEAVYFAFPFAMKQPQFQYEIQTGVVDPAKDMYAGAGHEWFSVQHWVAVQQDGISAAVMPLDVPLVTLGDINRGIWPTQFSQRTGTIFSYVMNNYWFTNYRAGQGGHFRFRYVVTSASASDAAGLSRMGWQETTPLEKDEVTSQDKAQNPPRPLDGKQESFLQVNDPNLLLEAWKPAEDGKGTILRFLDLGGATRTVAVQTPLLRLRQAWQTDSVERNQNQLNLTGNTGFQFTIHPHEIVTVRVQGKDATTQ
ncbi:MAG TPA: polysaccharide lyase family protein [Acidobacteriaceae bacterium]|nr:polysaccharide lyase family protein [Acidobacteriaceae bacterium]